MNRKQDDRPWCQAQTNAQLFGASWASTQQACSFHASTERDGTPMCGQHARQWDRYNQPQQQPSRA